ncbi:MAG: hypothetical protein ACJ77M_01580, partial [Thermoleophilaceae bacterium]
MGRTWGTAIVVLALAAMTATPAAAAPAQQTRYSLAGGCYSLSGVAGGEQIRMQATALGHYLLYRPDRTFLTSQSDGGVSPASQPSEAADWRVEEAGGGAFTLTPMSGTGRALTGVHFTPASGCAVYPEAELGATGTPAKNPISFGRVGGLVEGHMHWMTFEYLGGKFHCGKPWDKYGIQYALPDCSSDEGPQGSAAPVQN